MLVRATQRGFFGGVFRVPDTPTAEFTISEPEQFSDEWMEYVDAPEAVADPAPAPEPAPEPPVIKAEAPAAPTKAVAEKL